MKRKFTLLRRIATSLSIVIGVSGILLGGIGCASAPQTRKYSPPASLEKMREDIAGMRAEIDMIIGQLEALDRDLQAGKNRESKNYTPEIQARDLDATLRTLVKVGHLLGERRTQFRRELNLPTAELW